MNVSTHRRAVNGALLALVFAGAAAAAPARLPAGYLPAAESQPMIDKALRAHLAPDVSGLTPAERTVVERLIQAGQIFEDLHQEMRYPGAIAAREDLFALDRRLGSPAETANLVTLYYMSHGPVARMLDNQRRPFLPVASPPPGGSLYPADATRDEIDAWMGAHPEARASILAPRTVVRRADAGTLKRDLTVLRDHPLLDGLHPGLRASLEAKAKHPDRKSFYAVPYPVAFPRLLDCHRLLTEASVAIESEDEDLAIYLRNRARDLITNDYESGDASWVTGRFKTLNAEIGSYENYDDELYGTKTYFALSILKADHARSNALHAATAEIQKLEDSLPYNEGKPHKRVRSDIPVGVYDVLADFGQSRSANTATILPNDAGPARRYGRIIMLRRNIMESPELFEVSRAAYAAAVAEPYVSSFDRTGGSNRTLWHEIGHYLGVDRTRDGRDLDLALEQASAPLEEMKSDLVALYVAPALVRMGFYTVADLEPLYASGIKRVLLKNRPDRAQPYQTMELMQFNYFMDRGVLTFDAATARLSVHQEKFHDAVTAMLREVLELQAAGDARAAEDYIAKWTTWREDLHERVAESMRSTEKYRYTYVTFELLDPIGSAPRGLGRNAAP
jgi:hypothetical protein